MPAEPKLCSLCFSYAMDQLSEEESRRFALHLEQCGDCQATCADFRDLRSAVEEDLATERAQRVNWLRRRSSPWLRTGLGIAVAGFAFVVLLPVQDAFADRLQTTAHNLDTGIVHQVHHLGTAAHHIFQSHVKLPAKKIGV